jgi:hypothetical protein
MWSLGVVSRSDQGASGLFCPWLRARHLGLL